MKLKVRGEKKNTKETDQAVFIVLKMSEILFVQKGPE